MNMTTNTEQTRSTISRWYNEWWGKLDLEIIEDIVAEKYMRHDLTGASTLMAAKDYRDIMAFVIEGEKINHFSYFLIVEDSYVMALGHFILNEGRQWDWVQMFRIENERMAETWMPGMGGADPFGFPNPNNVWDCSEIPSPLPESPMKKVVSDYFQKVYIEEDLQAANNFMAPRIRVHDNLGSDVEMSCGEYVERMRLQINGSSITDAQFFMVGENNYIGLIATWVIDGERRWDWAQAFKFEKGVIAETWLSVIGGNDTSISHDAKHKWQQSVMPDESIINPLNTL